MDEIKIPNAREMGMLIDTTMCMSIYLFAKMCTKEEINNFFEDNVNRLLSQEFTSEEIDEHTNKVKTIVLDINKVIGDKK
jgi:hypothetical protein